MSVYGRTDDIEDGLIALGKKTESGLQSVARAIVVLAHAINNSNNGVIQELPPSEGIRV
jgi:hypothetical protein